MKYIPILVMLFSLTITFPSYAAIHPDLVKAIVLNDTRTLNFLLDAGEDIDAKNEDGMTLLIMAVEEGKINMVEILLSRGANVNIKDKEGKTPLMRAELKGYKRIVQMLKKAGAEE